MREAYGDSGAPGVEVELDGGEGYNAGGVERDVEWWGRDAGEVSFSGRKVICWFEAKHGCDE